MKFTYQPYQTASSPTVPSGILHRLEIPVRVTGATASHLLWAVVDTGSDDTFMFWMSLILPHERE